MHSESEREPSFTCETIAQSRNELKKIATNSINRTIFYDVKIAKKYGYQPKLVRMKILHNLLYHLIYDEIGKFTSSYLMELSIINYFK